ncbi:hypothetical protein GM3709_3349 [Geminocystis sp. NIES-3709]|nr:hypothetical protein GM3709_3349 [Geminocystis sp. NIES-3709]
MIAKKGLFFLHDYIVNALISNDLLTILKKIKKFDLNGHNTITFQWCGGR